MIVRSLCAAGVVLSIQIGIDTGNSFALAVASGLLAFVLGFVDQEAL